MLDDGSHTVANRRGIGNVGNKRFCGRSELGCRRLKRRGAARDQSHLAAFADKRLTYPQAEAPRRAGDDHDFSLDTLEPLTAHKPSAASTASLIVFISDPTA